CLIKGAPEQLLPRCVNAIGKDGETTTLPAISGILRHIDTLCAEGVRVIALTIAKPSAAGACTDPSSLTLVGFIGIRDELRPEAATAVSRIRGAGIQTVMITGDNAGTALAIAKKAGIIDRYDSESAVITSDAMARLSDTELTQRLPKLRLVARALPSDKSRLVRLAQEMGLVAGMTGDGVNDAPALKRADVGFAMGDGTEIAKEASDIVILDNNISSIAKAILYGRTIFKSIRKFIIFQLTLNFCAVGVSVIGPFIGVEAPVTIIQMLWINIIMDTLGAIAFAGEIPLDEYMKEPPKKRSERIINRYMYSQILFTGIYTVALCIAFIKLPFFLDFFRGDQRILMSAFFAMFIFAGVFNSFNARTHRLNLFAYIGRNKMFIIIMVAVTVIQLSMVYYGGELFRAAALRLTELAFVTALAMTVVLADTVRKLLMRAANRKGFV
ncbi:MAG: cation-translocating P-type ATPase, partial [Defluviitaleaceae bacterium]|nr:cation-translocating P-type ATPase [Defluviitaleaceae bacterium]